MMQNIKEHKKTAITTASALGVALAAAGAYMWYRRNNS
jgi:LPXTG-motif cell wall-anchored protein